MTSHSRQNSSDIIFYSTPESQISIEGVINDETFWLSRKRMAGLFSVVVSTINKRLQNMHQTQDLQRYSTLKSRNLDGLR